MYFAMEICSGIKDVFSLYPSVKSCFSGIFPQATKFLPLVQTKNPVHKVAPCVQGFLWEGACSSTMISKSHRTLSRPENLVFSSRRADERLLSKVAYSLALIRLNMQGLLYQWFQANVKHVRYFFIQKITRQKRQFGKHGVCPFDKLHSGHRRFGL
jgi:hypothetical protein